VGETVLIWRQAQAGTQRILCKFPTSFLFVIVVVVVVIVVVVVVVVVAVATPAAIPIGFSSFQKMATLPLPYSQSVTTCRDSYWRSTPAE
jgi:hypothetical protein